MAVSFESDIDILYGIGGAPEGIVSAAAVRALEGNMQARLLLRKDVKGETEENLKISESELLRCNKMGVEVNKVLELEELVKSDEIIFAATGITESTLLQPVMKNGNILKTDTLIIRGKSRTIRHINATHNLKEKCYRRAYKNWYYNLIIEEGIMLELGIPNNRKFKENFEKYKQDTKNKDIRNEKYIFKNSVKYMFTSTIFLC